RRSQRSREAYAYSVVRSARTAAETGRRKILPRRSDWTSRRNQKRRNARRGDRGAELRRERSSGNPSGESRADAAHSVHRRIRARGGCRRWPDCRRPAGRFVRGRKREMSWRATVLTIFPDMFPGPLGASLAGKALADNVWSCEARDIRDSATDKHRSVDDTPAGGGPGMVMRADVLARAIDAAGNDSRPRILLSARGKPLTQARVRELSAGAGVVLVCGRFEGVDERIIESRKLEEISVGDYVLSGGEIAPLTLLDACVRLLPGVMGKEASGAEESFEKDLLEYPQ